jgi:hypothetical protein
MPEQVHILSFLLPLVISFATLGVTSTFISLFYIITGMCL